MRDVVGEQIGANRQFVKDMHKWQRLTYNRINILVKRITAELFSQIILDTPVDSRYLGNSWTFSVLNPNFISAPKQKTVGKGRGKRKKMYGDLRSHADRVMRKVKSSIGMFDRKTGAETRYCLATGAPYVKMLEYGLYSQGAKTGKTVGGYSTQAPGGWIRKNVQIWENRAIAGKGWLNERGLELSE